MAAGAKQGAVVNGKHMDGKAAGYPLTWRRDPKPVEMECTKWNK